MKLRNFLFDFSTIIISIFCLFPIFTSNNTFRLMVISACFYIILSSIKKINAANNIPILKIASVLVISFAISYVVGIKDSINFFIYITILIVFILVFERYRIKGQESMKNVVFIILGFIFISAIQTIIMLNSNAAYSRTLTKNQDLVDVVGLSGGYGLVYACLLTFFSITFVVTKVKKISLTFRIILLLTSISSLILIWKAGFFLALLLLVFGSSIMIIGVKKQNVGKSIRFILIIFGVLLVFQSSISDFVIDKTAGTRYELKIKQIFDTDNAMSSSGSEFEERRNRYLTDLKVMLDYPIIGSWQFLLVGKHSFILDTLAQYGLIFGAFFIYYVLIIPYKLMVFSNHIAYTQSFIFFGVLFIFLLLNSLAIAIIPVVFVIFPYSNYILRLK